MPAYYAKKISDPVAQSALEVAASNYGRDNADHPQILRLQSVVPFDQFAISGLAYAGLGLGTGVILATNMPEAFIRTYASQALFKIDPLPNHVSPEVPWAHWQDLRASELARTDVRNFSALLDDHGIKRRSSLALFKGDVLYGGMTFTRDRPFTADELFVLEMAGRTLHATLSTEYLRRMNVHLGLSPGELACLKTAASGLSPEAATAATGYTPETIATYIKSATKKLGANNRTHAVAELLRRDMLD